MAKRPSQQERIVALLNNYEPAIRDAFLAAVRDIVDRAELGRLITALEQGNVEAALAALHIDTEAYQGLELAVRQSFVSAGTATVNSLPKLQDPTGGKLVIRFDIRDPKAEQWLTEHSSTMIREITEDQMLAARTALTEGLIRGDNPRTTALDIIGRTNKATGRREGGIIGLTSAQERYVANARAELMSGDAVQMQKYLNRQRRNKRFDPAVRAAIKGGKGIDAATVARMTGAYSDRLLQLRGETVGRTESMAAIHAASMEAYRQTIAKGNLPPSAVQKGWKATRDKRTRDTHRDLDGTFVGLYQRFPNGLLYPGDPDGPVAERANCRCRPIYRINRFTGLT